MRLHALLLLGGIAACTPPPTEDWLLASVYDGTALVGLTDPGGEGSRAYVWRPTQDMLESCGPAWAPLGLGVVEVEAMSTRLSPSLAIVLQHEGTPGATVPALTRDDVAVLDLRGEVPRRLEPAVLPHALRLSVVGEATELGEVAAWRKADIRQQVVTELCLEHKLGRAWPGGDSDQIAAALLLDSPEGAVDPALYFLGLGQPVPALLGPEQACIADGSPPPLPRPKELDAQPALQPGDIWNAGLKPCDPDAPPLPPIAERVAPLHFGGVPADLPSVGHWTDLEVALRGTEAGIEVSMRVDGVTVDRGDAPRYTEAPGEAIKVPDLLGALPRFYPRVPDLDAAGTERLQAGTGSTLTLLLIPAWQLYQNPLVNDPTRPADPVGDVLSDLSSLSVQVQRNGAWIELNPFLNDERRAWLSWGYPFDDTVTEGPVSGLTPNPLNGESSSDASRAPLQALMSISFAALALLLVPGLRRTADLWRRAPELSLERWIDRPPDRGDGGEA